MCVVTTASQSALAVGGSVGRSRSVIGSGADCFEVGPVWVSDFIGPMIGVCCATTQAFSELRLEGAKGRGLVVGMIETTAGQAARWVVWLVGRSAGSLTLSCGTNRPAPGSPGRLGGSGSRDVFSRAAIS